MTLTNCFGDLIVLAAYFQKNCVNNYINLKCRVCFQATPVGTPFAETRYEYILNFISIFTGKDKLEISGHSMSLSCTVVRVKEI